MTSFQKLAELAFVVAREGEETSMSALSRALRLTLDQAMPIIDEAEALGLVQKQDQRVRLTPPGLAFAVEIRERVDKFERKAFSAYTPYLEYVPERWWP